MTKFILAGGCDRKHPEYVENIARVVLATVDSPRILSCWFSNEDKYASKKFEEYKEYFKGPFGASAEIIMADKATFEDQVIRSDVVYLHGGNTTLLIRAMSQYKNVVDLLTEKIIIGSSAGANYLSSIGYSPSSEDVVYGSNIIDVACVVHYGSTGFSGMTYDSAFWDNAIRAVRLKTNKDILLLPEGKFAIFER